MQKQWVESKNKLVNNVGVCFGPSAVVSIEAEDLVTTEVDQSLLPMCTVEEAE